ncbi:hypothetical protein Tco_0654144 [Tanacetum coccineum]|uniref:Gag-Pol polyprotein n=1 Tax=Tanacetum coccineum TaxID=301880 RepID=A0ABQ4X2X4_9ASTR
MHNNIMTAGLRDRPPMLAKGRYAQWQSHFMRYIDTRPNTQPAIDDSPAVEEQTVLETLSNISPENKAHYEAEKEAIHLILTIIGDEIYSTVDACKIAHEMWIAIERLQQGESLNKQDVKTSLFWEFGRFTLRDGKTIESYYFRFYRMINEMVRNKLEVATMQVNVQFLQQLQPEWSRFMTVVKQTVDLDKESYHKLFDILKQYQKEVDEICAEKIARNAYPLALIYKPTNNNLITSLHTRNKNVDTSPRYKNKNQTGQFGNQRTVTVAGARETCMKPKRVKDYTYYKEKMLLCKQAEKGVPLQAEQANWIEDTDEEIDEQELEAQYMYMAKIQEVPTADLGPSFDVEPLEEVDSNVIPDSSDMCNNENQSDQNAEECDDERVVLANLIANLKLDTIPYDTSDLANIFAPDREETLTLEQQSRSKLNKDLVKPYDYTKQNSLYEILHHLYGNILISWHMQMKFERKCGENLLELVDQAWDKHSNDKFCAPTAHDMNIHRVIHQTSVSRPQLKSTQTKDKVVQNNSQVKVKKTKVEERHRISSISNKTKSVTACNDSLKSKTLNVNVVCATCEKCVFNSNHDACVSKFLTDVNARSKKPQEVPTRTRKPKRKVNKSVATPPKKTVASESTIQKSKSYYRMLYEKTSKAWKWWIEQ